MRLTILAGAVAAAAPLYAGAAGAYELTVQNLTSADVVAISADPGEIVDFRRVGAGTNRSFEITVPEGECEVDLSFRFDDSTTSEGATDVCTDGMVRITEQY